MRFLSTLFGSESDVTERFDHVALHPLFDAGLPERAENFPGSALRCHCPEDRVVIEVAAQSVHPHLCGCTRCWKPVGALFSLVAAVPRGKVTIMQNEDKLEVVDPSVPILRHACTGCGVHMFGRIEDEKHPLHGLDWVHQELADLAGWSRPTFASYVSSIIEVGVEPDRMAAVRARLTELGLTAYDCWPPEIMDQVSTWRARMRGVLL
ncbi:S-(hydroxymethyl)glutathione synthase [Roseivivax sediminis]|uniref:S-(hydroxymethyl)glutathione synthase n=1 Tax=Roseivivax sediminis TaxID=936889 RepID=A0A1I2AEQ6_9RHOB|nr:S-(hydroxymethyl)glutathione synthase [Roseivivax sediminis]SFE42038.1 S-(hydroxymethyl)glutathione synthase [Roseivivax sediminis]